jgi:hypothetical protein
VAKKKKFSAKVTGADRVARQYEQVAADIPVLLSDAQKSVAEDAELILAGFALKDSGRMARGIRAVQSGASYVVTAEAKNPVDGYDYVGVTRFGHKKRLIKPKYNRAKASVVDTEGKRKQRKGAALRIPLFGEVIYRSSVRGFHPLRDWVSEAVPTIEKRAGVEIERLSAKISRRLS